MLASKKATTRLIALGKPTGELYAYLYHEHDMEQQVRLLHIIGRQAANPNLSLTWREAAQLSAKIRGKT